MTTVRVSPKLDRSAISHDISLRGKTTLGLKFANGSPAVFQRIPMSDPVRIFTETQNTWTSGSYKRYFRDDINGFMDASGWTMTDGKFLPQPQWHFGNTVRTNVSFMPGDVTWKKLISTTNGGSHLYIASQPGTAITSADSAMLVVRQVGMPGTLTVKVVNNSGGNPTGSTLQTVTATPTAGDFVSKYKIFDWSGTQTTVSTDWIYIYGATGDTESDHWEVGVDDGTAGSVISSDGSSWSTPSDTFKMYYHLTVADPAQRLWYFTSEGALYAVNGTNDTVTATSFKLYINGDRGQCTSATTTVLTDTNAGVTGGWTTDEWKAGGISASASSGAWVKIVSGPCYGQARQITANTGTTITVSPAFSGTPSASSRYVIYKTPKWTLLTGHAGSYPCTGRPASFNTYFAIPQGSLAGTIMGHEDTANANNHGWLNVAAAIFDYYAVDTASVPGSKLYAANAGTALLKYVTLPTTFTSFGAFTGVASTSNAIGTKDYPITSLTASSGKLLIGKANGLWYMNGTTPTEYQIQALKDLPSFSNCAAASADGDVIMMGYAGSVGKLEGTQFVDLLNYKSGGTGIPADRRGNVSAIIKVAGWWLFAFDGGTSNYSTVQAWNGMGWHEVFRPWATGVRIRDIYHQQSQDTNPRIWVDCGGEPVYFDLPFNQANPTYDSTFEYQHESVLVSGIMDIEKPNLYKLFHEIRVVSENMSLGNRWTEIDYQLNDDVETTVWRRLGDVTQSPLDIVNVDIGEANKIRFRYRSYTNDNLIPPILTNLDVWGEVSDVPKNIWLGTFEVGGANPQTYDRQKDFDGTFIVDWLTDAHVHMTPLVMRANNTDDDGPIGAGRKVVVSAPEVTKDSVRQGVWHGRIALRFQEV